MLPGNPVSSPSREDSIDTTLGIWRAVYNIRMPDPPLATPELTARTYLERNAARFGLTTSEPLVIIDHVRTNFSTHLTFQQTYRGLPVYKRTVKVNLGRDGRPTMVLNTFAPHVDAETALEPTPFIVSNQATRQAQALITPNAATSTEPELMVYPATPPQLAWRHRGLAGRSTR